ncbi:hypothetical protein PYW07_017443 [Mythimna separata]|uniref:Uncharacterized protein n=1 Tax=Mythimna separata TaxID=271217 RepID=A0AAD7YWN3_MYTSE|nr:hypothetical protein PYW07_017443 [Mythimna separata]
MSQLDEVVSAQKTLEDCVLRKMEELESQIQSAGPAKDTVARVADEFRTFRELVFSMFKLLRSQISECAKQVDGLETRHRRKALVFQGIAEVDGENASAVVLDVINKRLVSNSLPASSIKACHRLGVAGKAHHRPILVRFSSYEDKSAVWKAKKGLKGTSISVKEFLTKTRQTIFGKARLHFGMRDCWTQDGIIIVKAPDGSKHKVTSFDVLNPLLAKYPKAQGSDNLQKKPR